MKLFSRIIGEDGIPLVVLHGLFGMNDNWMTLGKLWAEERAVHLVDQRNHGQSPRSDEWTYELMAQDVIEYLEDQKLDQVHLLGHSMGGKTAMCLAAERPELLKSLIIVDIGPKQYPVHHRTIVNALKSVPLDQLKSRREVDQKLEEGGIPEVGVRQFLMKSLHRKKEGGFEWRFHINVIDKELDNVGQMLPEELGFEGPSLFVRGEKSGYILDDDLPGIHRQFPLMELETINNAGHWVHAEQPELLLNCIQTFIQKND